ncbi:MAG: hypothetical protein M0000_02550 [Actinomycetota bacterium]|nr:hypothetical protein [Actinomycetota bacterium]
MIARVNVTACRALGHKWQHQAFWNHGAPKVCERCGAWEPLTRIGRR